MQPKKLAADLAKITAEKLAEQLTFVVMDPEVRSGRDMDRFLIRTNELIATLKELVWVGSGSTRPEYSIGDAGLDGTFKSIDHSMKVLHAMYGPKEG